MAYAIIADSALTLAPGVALIILLVVLRREWKRETDD